MRDRLAEAPRAYDVVVVGGGINGAAVARDAALRGFRVGLVEQHDFASGTSSRTSKLVHGGVRYLEHGALRLVWEASHERRRLLRLAPHLVRPLPFVLPVYRDSRFGPARLRLGMMLYDLLAAFRNVQRHRVLRAAQARDWCEGLRTDGLRGGALYWDATMDDARLVLVNAIGAREAGATVLNRAACERFHTARSGVAGIEVHDLESGRRATWQARIVVACAGAWTNSLLAAFPGAGRPVAPTRGAHIVVRRLVDRAFTLAAGRDGRVFFVLPWEGRTLIGTTDIADESVPERVAPSREEIDYLLEAANQHFPTAHLDQDDVIASFAGLRPLLQAGGRESARSREHALLEPAPGLLAVVGGKFTTYRAVAEAVVQRIEVRLEARRACRTRKLPLPGGDLEWSAPEHWAHGPRFAGAAAAIARRAGVAPTVAERWLAEHGTRAAQIAALAAESDLAAPLAPGETESRAEVVHAIRAEFALRLEDWFLRRTRAAYRPGNGLGAVEPAADLFARELGWDRARRDHEVESCRALLCEIAAAS